MQSRMMESSIGSCSSGLVNFVNGSTRAADVCTSSSSLRLRQRENVVGSVVLRANKIELLRCQRSRKAVHGIAAVRAERGDGGLREKLNDLASEEAVESLQGIDRSARLMASELKSDHVRTSPRELILEAEEKALEADESLGGRKYISEIASDSAVDPEHVHEDTVEIAKRLAPELGRSVEDLTVALEEGAEEASERDAELLRSDEGIDEREGEAVEGKAIGTLDEREKVLQVASDSAVEPEHVHDNTLGTAEEIAPEVGRSVEELTSALEDSADEASQKDAELLSTDKGSLEWDGGVGQVVDVQSEGGVIDEENDETELTREEATRKVLDVAKEGFGVLKRAAQGVVTAGVHSRENLGVAKEMVDERLKSLNLAAEFEGVKEESAELSEAAKRKYEELQRPVSKFSEELRVQLEEKKVADEGKPDSETNPLAKLSQGLKTTFSAAVKEDGPLGKLAHGLQDNFAKVTEGQGSAQKQELDSLVPVGEKEGCFQDLAPASGASPPQPGDRSTEASDIMGSDLQEDTEQKFEGFFGDIPVDRSGSSPQEDSEQKFEGFFGDIPVDRSGSSPEVGGDQKAVEAMKKQYEDEVGNKQLSEVPESGLETPAMDAADESDVLQEQPFSKDPVEAMKKQYEHEVGNELLKPNLTSEGPDDQ